jgi:transglutaminase-like putative cysteine protease
MTWRLGITHRTGYRYGGPVSSSYNEARLTPRTEEGQLVLDHRIDISPTAQVSRYTDYWGTEVTSFDLHIPHDALEVTAHCVLESAVAAPVDGTGAQSHEATVSWDELAEDAVRDRWVELLLPTRFTTADERILAVSEELRRLTNPLTAALAAVDWVRDQMSYVSGATGVHTSATDALAEGKGVCQDFAHGTLALLRSLGIPGRYVSGYMHPDRKAPLGVTVAGESHAWIEYWTGAWRGYDPTNGRIPDEAYAVVARGRDYLDVAPMRGLYTGAAQSELQVSVDVTRLA